MGQIESSRRSISSFTLFAHSNSLSPILDRSSSCMATQLGMLAGGPTEEHPSMVLISCSSWAIRATAMVVCQWRRRQVSSRRSRTRPPPPVPVNPSHHPNPCRPMPILLVESSFRQTRRRVLLEIWIQSHSKDDQHHRSRH
jgi:hypothetical protein